MAKGNKKSKPKKTFTVEIAAAAVVLVAAGVVYGVLVKAKLPDLASTSTTQSYRDKAESNYVAMMDRSQELRMKKKADAFNQREFQLAALPLIRGYIFSNYGAFADSSITFRDLKLYISKRLNIPYEELRSDEKSAVIEDAVDVIANKCEGGKLSRLECADKVGYDLDLS